MPPKPVEVTHTSVFANGSRGGNPCPVILDAADLGPEQMQAIARRYGQESGSWSAPRRSAQREFRHDPAAGRPAADGMGARFFHRRWGRSSHRYLLGLRPRLPHPLWHSIFRDSGSVLHRISAGLTPRPSPTPGPAGSS